MNGERYEGELRDGAKHGKGTYKYVNGNEYKGEWKADRKNGHGVYDYYSTQEKYDGQWVRLQSENKIKKLNNFAQADGEKHGYGVYGYAYGDRYEGNWKEGEKSGKGKLEYASGAIYEGEWLGDKAHG